VPKLERTIRMRCFSSVNAQDEGSANAAGYSSFAIGVDRSDGPRKTTPRDLLQATVIAKLL
jgi:hypothetical protein